MRDPNEWAAVPNNDYNAAGQGYITSDSVIIDPVTKDLVIKFTKRAEPITKGNVARTHNTGYVRSRGHTGTNFTKFGYGRFEWVARHNGVRGRDTGFFPALWLRTFDPSVSKGEPDVIEYFGGKGDKELLGCTMHWNDGTKTAKRWLPPAGTENDWHRYTLDLTPDYLRYYYDGEVKMEIYRSVIGNEKWYSAMPKNTDWCVIMNTDCGGGTSTWVDAPNADTAESLEWRIKSFNYWDMSSGIFG